MKLFEWQDEETIYRYIIHVGIVLERQLYKLIELNMCNTTCIAHIQFNQFRIGSVRIC